MAHPLRLEVFETLDIPDGPALMMPDQIEDIRLNAYERGYRAGWEDGGVQTDAQAATRRLAIERQMERLDFTYHDARGHILSALEPLLAAVIGTVLPAAARAAIVPLVVETLMPLAHVAATHPIRLSVGPGGRVGFSGAFDGLVMPPIEIVEDPQLHDTQAEFVFGATETRIDLSHAADAAARALARFYQIATEELNRA